jgi:hypothetical protein
MKGRTPSKQMSKSRWWLDQASREEMESGVLVGTSSSSVSTTLLCSPASTAVDKGRTSVLYAMLFVGYLNTRVVREQVTYKNTYGDKESFWMATELLGVPYHLDAEYAGAFSRLFHLYFPSFPSYLGLLVLSTCKHTLTVSCAPHRHHRSAHASRHEIAFHRFVHPVGSPLPPRPPYVCFLSCVHLQPLMLFRLAGGKPLWWNGSLFQEKRVKDRFVPYFLPRS